MSTMEQTRCDLAVLAAYRAARSEYEAGPCCEWESAAYTQQTATSVAFNELRKYFYEMTAKMLANALAHAAACSHNLCGVGRPLNLPPCEPYTADMDAGQKAKKEARHQGRA
jgi:hypothetical protein